MEGKDHIASRDHDQTVTGAVHGPAAEHTPGPWVIDSATLPGDVVRDAAGRAVAIPFSHGFTPAVLAANLGLIAAAPDLLAALRSIAANTCCDTCREAALVARAALARIGEVT
jgi:hypothetical protein